MCLVVAHDALPYATAGLEDVYGVLKESGRFLATQRTEGTRTRLALLFCTL